MLAAILCNLEQRGPILRERRINTLKGVEDAAIKIEELLYPVPAKTKTKIKRAVEKAYEYAELPTIDMSVLSEASQKTQAAIRDIESLLIDLNDPEWLIEMRVILSQLVMIQMTLNDDEEALLLLM